jgi:hypothetical protein
MSSTASVTHLYSPEFEKLASVFSHIHPPYKQEDVRAFSTLYSRLYRELTVDEKKYAERMVDLIIEGLERREDAILLYGVV